MDLIQILLPLYDNEGRPWTSSLHERVKDELTTKFGGITAYTRSPAEGQWSQNGHDVKDDIVVYEVMVADLDAAWWHAYRKGLEDRFRQAEIIIRSLAMRLL